MYVYMNINYFFRAQPVKKKTTLDTGPPRDDSDSDNDLNSDNEEFYEDIVSNYYIKTVSY